MPSHVISNSALERQLLVQLGGRLRTARVHQGWTASQMAERVGISCTTLASVEAGAASPAIGTDLKVVGVLGLAGDLALVATGEGTAKRWSWRTSARHRCRRPGPIQAGSTRQ